MKKLDQLHTKDLAPMYKKYKGNWVALADDEFTVLGFGKTIKEAILMAKKKSDVTPIMTYAPKDPRRILSLRIGIL